MGESPKYLPNYKRRAAVSFFKPLLHLLATNFNEKIYKGLQLKLMPKLIKQMASSWESKVVVSDKILKFHTNDRRLELNAKFK